MNRNILVVISLLTLTTIGCGGEEDYCSYVGGMWNFTYTMKSNTCPKDTWTGNRFSTKIYMGREGGECANITEETTEFFGGCKQQIYTVGLMDENYYEGIARYDIFCPTYQCTTTFSVVGIP
jgi:hypothetical protein